MTYPCSLCSQNLKSGRQLASHIIKFHCNETKSSTNDENGASISARATDSKSGRMTGDSSVECQPPVKRSKCDDEDVAMKEEAITPPSSPHSNSASEEATDVDNRNIDDETSDRLMIDESGEQVEMSKEYKIHDSDDIFSIEDEIDAADVDEPANSDNESQIDGRRDIRQLDNGLLFKDCQSGAVTGQQPSYHTVVMPEYEVGNPAPKVKLPRPPTASEKVKGFISVRTLSGKFSHICIECCKIYRSRYNVKRHVEVHRGQEKFECSECFRKFTRKQVFEAHVRTHTGERPFACDKCGKTYSQLSHRQYHQKKCNEASGNKDIVSQPVVTLQNINDGNEFVLLKPGQPSIPIRGFIEDGRVKNGCNNNNIQLSVSQSSETRVHLESVSKRKLMNEVAEMDDENVVIIDPISLSEITYDDIVDDSTFDDPLLEEIQIEPDLPDFVADDKSGMVDKFTCAYCDATFTDQLTLLGHLGDNHVTVDCEPDQLDLEVGFIKFPMSTRAKFLCLACGIVNLDGSQTVDHVKNVHQMIYDCSECEHCFLTDKILQNHHCLTHKMICPHCDASPSFSTSEAAYMHESSCPSKLSSVWQTSPQVTLQMGQTLPTSSAMQTLSASVTLKDGTSVVLPSAPEPQLMPVVTSKVLPKGLVITPAASQPKQPIVPESLSLVLRNNRTTSISRVTSGSNDYISNKLVPFNSQNPVGVIRINRPRSGSNANGSEYIPDNNSNNVVNVTCLEPPPTDEEQSLGYCRREIGNANKLELGKRSASSRVLSRIICLDCGKHYTTMYNMKQHRHLHNSASSLYECNFCNKRFTHRHIWKTHMRIHTGERPFKCDKCGKDFADRSNFNSHRKSFHRLD